MIVQLAIRLRPTPHLTYVKPRSTRKRRVVASFRRDISSRQRARNAMASGSTLAATERIETDVLIIGGGAAGMIAAVAATRAGVKPLVVTKGTYASGSSSMARGGYAIAIGHVDPEDNPQFFLEDAITVSYGLANPLLSQLMCEESIPRTLELDAWGLGLAKQPDGRFDQRESSRPHRYRRLVHCGKLMGKPLMHALSKKTK